MKRICTVILLAGLLASCRSTKKIQTAIAKKDSVEVVTVTPGRNDSALVIKNTLEAIRKGRIDFKTFSGKVNIDYRDADNKNYNLNANIRMYKDSAIWISVNAILGIEAMRAYITKDSVKLLDKQNKVYTARSVDYLQEVTALPLNLYTLQDLLIGNPVFLEDNVVSYARGNNTLSLLSVGKWFKNLVTVNEENKTLLRSKLDDVDLPRNRTADLTYDDYENKGGILFSTDRKITVSEKKKLDISLEFKQYDFNGEVSFPFSVPKNYKQR